MCLGEWWFCWLQFLAKRSNLPLEALFEFGAHLAEVATNYSNFLTKTISMLLHSCCNLTQDPRSCYLLPGTMLPFGGKSTWFLTNGQQEGSNKPYFQEHRWQAASVMSSLPEKLAAITLWGNLSLSVLLAAKVLNHVDSRFTEILLNSRLSSMMS